MVALLTCAAISVVQPIRLHAQAPAAAPVGDPTGAATGTAKDVPVKDPAAPTLPEVMETVGHNKVSINIVWPLLAGFLVMFMQAGFAMVETGFCRAKNAAHTMSMNFMVYPIGMFGYWLCGFALQMGGVGNRAALGGTPPRSILSEYHAVNSRRGIFLLADGRYKYVHYVEGPPQLFDLHTDPSECRDLAEEPGHQALRSELERRLRSMVDPEAVDLRARTEQAALIESYGGESAVLSRGTFDNSPIPGETPHFKDASASLALPE